MVRLFVSWRLCARTSDTLNALRRLANFVPTQWNHKFVKAEAEARAANAAKNTAEVAATAAQDCNDKRMPLGMQREHHAFLMLQVWM